MLLASHLWHDFRAAPHVTQRPCRLLDHAWHLAAQLLAQQLAHATPQLQAHNKGVAEQSAGVMFGHAF